MIRGTTAKITFNIPVETNQIAVAYVTFTSDGVVAVEKKLADLTLEDNKVICRLTQAESLSFTPNSRVRVQLRARLKDGTTIASKIRDVTVGNVLKEGII